MPLVLLALSLCALSVQAQSAKSILGNWKDENKPEKQIQMYELADGKVEGKVINDNRKNSQNGFLIFKNLVWNEKAKTYSGRLISPDDSSTFDIVLNLVNNDRFEFKVKKLFLTKTFHFVRIN